MRRPLLSDGVPLPGDRGFAGDQDRAHGAVMPGGQEVSPRPRRLLLACRGVLLAAWRAGSQAAWTRPSTRLAADGHGPAMPIHHFSNYAVAY